MKKLAILLSAVFLLVGIFMGTSFAVPAYSDYYKHPNDVNSWQQSEDVIGPNPPFEIYGHDWLLTECQYSFNLQLKIWTDWDRGLDGHQWGSQLGDVFIYLPEVTYAVAVRDHNYLDPASPEYNDGIDKGDIFIPEGYRLSNDYFSSWSYSSYGDNEIVTAYGDPEDSAIVDLFYPGPLGTNYILIDFGCVDDVNVDVAPPIRFTQTCANDVHDTVPEPATMLLLGSGLIGLAFLGRKKLFKK